VVVTQFLVLFLLQAAVVVLVVSPQKNLLKGAQEQEQAVDKILLILLPMSLSI
jgi:hypothetical protein